MLKITQEDTAAIVARDLMSISDAAKETGRSWWAFRRLLDKGLIDSVRMPTGHRAVLRSSLEAYLRGQK
jgi:hypothetical protein